MSDLAMRFPSATPMEVYTPGNLPNPIVFKGAITVASDFPTLALVHTGWLYTILANVTDNDPTKTNTGQSFLVGDEIVWNGTNWTNIGGVLTGFLKLDQTSPQSIINGLPLFQLGLNIGVTTSDALLHITSPLTNGVYPKIRLTDGDVAMGGKTWEIQSGIPSVSDSYFGIYDVTDNLQVLTISDSGVFQFNPYTTNGFVKFTGANGTLGVDTNTYLSAGLALLLDQTTPQTVINGIPIFDAGITSNGPIDAAYISGLSFMGYGEPKFEDFNDFIIDVPFYAPKITGELHGDASAITGNIKPDSVTTRDLSAVGDILLDGDMNVIGNIYQTGTFKSSRFEGDGTRLSITEVEPAFNLWLTNPYVCGSLIFDNPLILEGDIYLHGDMHLFSTYYGDASGLTGSPSFNNLSANNAVFYGDIILDGFSEPLLADGSNSDDTIGDFNFFQNLLIDDTDLSKSIYLWRHANKFDTYMRMFINDAGVATIVSDYALWIGSTTGLTPIWLYASSLRVGEYTGGLGPNPEFRLYGTITGDTERYVCWLLDTDGYLKLSPSYNTILGYKIDIPVDLLDNPITTTNTGYFGELDVSQKINPNMVETVLQGSTSGTATCSMPFQGASYKKVIIYCDALVDATSTVYTFPTAFSHTPYVYGDASAIAVATTTEVTLIGVTTDGNIFVEGN